MVGVADRMRQPEGRHRRGGRELDKEERGRRLRAAQIRLPADRDDPGTAEAQEERFALLLDPLYSGLQVATPENGTEILHVYEMFALPLSGAVVVCSACQTARGLIRAGEGLVGMSRALFYAGAVWLVLSLWPVPDAPTRRLMRAFHRRLRTRPDHAWALSLAKQDVRASHPGVYRHPYT